MLPGCHSAKWQVAVSGKWHASAQALSHCHMPCRSLRSSVRRLRRPRAAAAARQLPSPSARARTARRPRLATVRRLAGSVCVFEQVAHFQWWARLGAEDPAVVITLVQSRARRVMNCSSVTASAGNEQFFSVLPCWQRATGRAQGGLSVPQRSAAPAAHSAWRRVSHHSPPQAASHIYHFFILTTLTPPPHAPPLLQA